MGKKIDWPVEQMRDWYETEGLTCQEIGERLNRSAKLVWKVCNRHSFQMRKTGAVGERNGCWSGGRTIDKSGYVPVKVPADHPHKNHCGYIREHRLIAEQMLGRY